MKKIAGVVILILLILGFYFFSQKKIVSPVPKQPDIKVIFEEKERKTIKVNISPTVIPKPTVEKN